MSCRAKPGKFGIRMDSLQGCWILQIVLSMKLIYTLNGIKFRNPAQTLRQAQSDSCAGHTVPVEVFTLEILKNINAGIYPVHSITLRYLESVRVFSYYCYHI